MRNAILLGLLLASPALAISTLPAFQGGVQSNAVWQMPKSLATRCNQVTTPDDYLSCVLGAMQKDKASDQAIAMMKLSRGTITDFKKLGDVTVVNVAVPAADHSNEFYVINDNGDVIDVDDAAILSSVDITKASNYNSLATQYPNISIWPGNHQYPVYNALPGGITQLVFSYSLLNGCYACDLAGIAKVAFNFDDSGSFVGAQLLELDPPPVNMTSSNE